MLNDDSMLPHDALVFEPFCLRAKEDKFDEYQAKLYEYRLEFFKRGQVKLFLEVLRDLPSLTIEQRYIQELAGNYNYNELCEFLMSIENNHNFHISMMSSLHSTAYESAFEEQVAFSQNIYRWYKRALELKESSSSAGTEIPDEDGFSDDDEYADESECPDESEHFDEGDCVRSIGMTQHFLIHFDKPFDIFEAKLEDFKLQVKEIYELNKVKYGKILVPDYLRKSNGDRISIESLVEKWDRCLLIYDASKKDYADIPDKKGCLERKELKKKDGSPNYTNIGKAAGLSGIYSHNHHLVNRTKDYLNDAAKLISSALNMTFPD